MSDILEMKTLDVGDQKFECVDGYLRGNYFESKEKHITLTRDMGSTYGCIDFENLVKKGTIERQDIYTGFGDADMVFFEHPIKKGDSIEFVSDYTKQYGSNHSTGIILAPTENGGEILESIDCETLRANGFEHTFQNDGHIFMNVCLDGTDLDAVVIKNVEKSLPERVDAIEESIGKLEESIRESIKEPVEELEDFEGVFGDYILGSLALPDNNNFRNNIGKVLPNGVYTKSNTGNFRFLTVKVNKGDKFVRVAMGSTGTMALFVLDNSNKLVDIFSYYDGNEYTMPCDGSVVAYCDWNNALDAVMFKIERNKEEKQDAVVNTKYVLYPVTLADVEINKRCPLSVYAYPGTTLSELDNACTYDANYCVLKREVKKGDVVIFTNAHQMSGEEQKITVMGVDGLLADVIHYGAVESPSHDAAIWSSFMNGYYEVPCDGILYMSFPYTDVNVGEFFYIKTPHLSEPIVLYEHLDYDTEHEGMGDKVMKALMEGRQVLVRVENADGKDNSALYSPIYQWQVPNKLNNYLYLYYLRDFKQNLDLSVMGIGTVPLPIYAQIKLKVSHTYNHTPLV